MSFELIDLASYGDENGRLVPLESGKEVPFDIKRVYYIYDTKKDFVRGKHAHKNLEQYIICVKGSCDFHLDDGKEVKNVHMDSPGKALYVKSNIWREFTNFSPDCVLVVLANMPYTESDYIRNYEEFLKCVR